VKPERFEVAGLRGHTDTAALMPGAKVEVIPDSGHFPWLEQPRAFRAAVERLVWKPAAT
jgi:pimeloyl-ACP methyl ester carboxylesterase